MSPSSLGSANRCCLTPLDNFAFNLFKVVLEQGPSKTLGVPLSFPMISAKPAIEHLPVWSKPRRPSFLRRLASEYMFACTNVMADPKLTDLRTQTYAFVCVNIYHACIYVACSALRKAPTNITCMLNTIVPCSAQSANKRHPATIETTPSCICPAQSADNIHLATSEIMPNCVCPAQRANSTYEHNAT